MKLSGTIKSIFDPFSGTSKQGNPYTKQDFVLTLDGGGNYPDEILISAFGDEKLALVQNFTAGQHVDLLVDIRTREANGRYYNDVNLYRLESNTAKQPASAPAPAPAPAPMPQAPAEPQPLFDDVPF